MTQESQNIEFKESWRDEYLKWICGFANAQGGTLYIGVSDNGEVCGLQDAKILMEDIPNKVRDLLGILVDVNLKAEDGKEYLEIITESYPYPISYRGHYYQRSGATNQELKGASFHFGKEYARTTQRTTLNEGVNEGVNKGVNEGDTHIDAINQIEDVSDTTKIELAKILRLFRDNEGLKLKDIALRIGRSTKSVERYLKILKDLSLIEFRGSPRNGKYYVVE